MCEKTSTSTYLVLHTFPFKKTFYLRMLVKDMGRASFMQAVNNKILYIMLVPNVYIKLK